MKTPSAGRAQPWATAIVVAAIVVRVAALRAIDASYDLNVSERMAVPALQSVARQTGTPIFFSPEQLRDVRTPPIMGRLTVRQAISRLLAGTPLCFVVSAQGTIIVRRRGAAET